jgi:hypothetical protein
MKTRDVAFVEKSSGWELTIRYLLPRTSTREGDAEADGAVLRARR